MLYPVSAFDKVNAKDFTFTWSGFQSVKNKLIIKNNLSNAIVYSQEQITMQLKHTLPINTLVNGTLYNAQIQVFDSFNNTSVLSDPVLFYCYAAPLFNFSNLTNNQAINSSSYGLQLSYSQAQGEVLNSYQINLYNAGLHIIHQSGVRYDTSVLKYTVSGLENDQAYYIEAVGKTLNGMDVTTGKIFITVEYIQPNVFNLLSTINLDKQGVIKYNSNIVSIVGTSSPSPTYIDNSKIDLTANGTWAKFSEDFTIEKDFTLQIHGYNFPYEKQLVVLDNNIHQIEVKLRKNKFNSQTMEKAYLELISHGRNANYFLISNYIDVPLPTDMLQFWVRRKNNYYELKLSKII